MDKNMVIGDWGLGIGDWAIPNPQSPIPKLYYSRDYNSNYLIIYLFKIKLNINKIILLLIRLLLI